MGVYGSLCASIAVYGSIRKFMGVWININSGLVYLCVIYRWYVRMCLYGYMRLYGSLWRATGMESKHP